MFFEPNHSQSSWKWLKHSRLWSSFGNTIWTINTKDRRGTGITRKRGRKIFETSIVSFEFIPIEIFSFIHINGNSGGQFERAFPLTFSISLQSSVKSSLFLTMKRKWWQIHFSLAALKVDKTTIGSRLLSCFVENWQLRASPYLICTILQYSTSRMEVRGRSFQIIQSMN